MKLPSKDDLILIAVMLAWAFANCAWVFWPEMGVWMGFALNGAVVLILIAGIVKGKIWG